MEARGQPQCHLPGVINLGVSLVLVSPMRQSGWLTSRRNPPVFTFPELGLEVDTMGFYLGLRDSGPHACKTSILSTKRFILQASGTHYVDQDSTELSEIHLPLTTEWWD